MLNVLLDSILRHLRLFFAALKIELSSLYVKGLLSLGDGHYGQPMSQLLEVVFDVCHKSW